MKAIGMLFVVLGMLSILRVPALGFWLGALGLALAGEAKFTAGDKLAMTIFACLLVLYSVTQ